MLMKTVDAGIVHRTGFVTANDRRSRARRSDGKPNNLHQALKRGAYYHKSFSSFSYYLIRDTSKLRGCIQLGRH